jgi:hypothetical protein
VRQNLLRKPLDSLSAREVSEAELEVVDRSVMESRVVEPVSSAGNSIQSAMSRSRFASALAIVHPSRESIRDRVGRAQMPQNRRESV